MEDLVRARSQVRATEASSGKLALWRQITTKSW